MFNKKKKEISKIGRIIEEQRHELISLERKVARLEDGIDLITTPSEDTNILFASIIDYHKVIKRINASDPILARKEVQDVFAKYKIKLPKV